MNKQGKQMNLDKVLLDMYSTFGIDQDNDKLLEKLVKAVVDYTNCDGGTLYLKRKNCLEFKIVLTKSKNIFENLTEDNPKTKDFIPVPLTKNFASAHCAMEKRTVNIGDIYEPSEYYDFSGARNYDLHNKYKTVSILNFPIENDFGEIIAVVQLINAMEDGKIIPFPTYYNSILESFGAQAGIVLRNMEYAKENTEQLHSFVEVLTTAIDELSKFNSNHTKNMVEFANTFLDWLDKEKKPLHFTRNERDQLIMSMRLHDIGKITTPPEILNKVHRLDARMEILIGRIEKMIQAYQIAYFEEQFEDEMAEEKIMELKEVRDFIQKINSKDRLTPEEFEKLQALKNEKYRSVNGRDEALFTIEEYESLSAKRGNLTPDQWEKMENHVVMTEKFLEKIKFSNTYQDVCFWASAHHEMLNGKGYPHGLSGDEIPKAVRLITIIDSYEAMVASDRPYKKPKTPKVAIDILRDRVEKGELDPQIVELFAESLGLA